VRQERTLNALRLLANLLLLGSETAWLGAKRNRHSNGWSRGSDPRLLRLTLDKLPDHASGERPRASKAVPYPKARLFESNVFVLLCQLD
jgi:hypothetical protein